MAKTSQQIARIAREIWPGLNDIELAYRNFAVSVFQAHKNKEIGGAAIVQRLCKEGMSEEELDNYLQIFSELQEFNYRIEQ